MHSIDRVKIAQRLSAARPAGLPPLQVCIQVNIGGEHTKSGVAPADALRLARAVAALPRLKAARTDGNSAGISRPGRAAP